jgi:tetratricopeptide (TPR) repeat protein
LIESRAVQFDTAGDDRYLSFSYLIGQRLVLPLNLQFLGEWGDALRELEEAITLLDKNADNVWGRSVRMCRAFVHLHAMDFAGVLAICNSALPLLRDPGLRPAPADPAPFPMEFRMCLTLTGAAQTGLGNYDSALEHLLTASGEMGHPAVAWDWWWRMPVASALTELWLAKCDLAQARSQAKNFLNIALATAEHTWQALAWEVNARVEMAEEEWSRAEQCIAKALLTIEGYDVPLAAWRVHGTAAALYAGRENDAVAEHPAAEHHRELSRAIILKLADSLAAEEALRKTFLSAPAVRKVLAGGLKRRTGRALS